MHPTENLAEAQFTTEELERIRKTARENNDDEIAKKALLHTWTRLYDEPPEVSLPEETPESITARFRTDDIPEVEFTLPKQQEYIVEEDVKYEEGVEAKHQGATLAALSFEYDPAMEKERFFAYYTIQEDHANLSFSLAEPEDQPAHWFIIQYLPDEFGNVEERYIGLTKIEKHYQGLNKEPWEYSMLKLYVN